MKISAFGWIVELSVRREFWEDEIVRRINKDIPASHPNDLKTKVERIKRVRALSRMFPRQFTENTGVVSLSNSKVFVETHWR